MAVKKDDFPCLEPKKRRDGSPFKTNPKIYQN
jgi:hypothetical protein